MKIFSRLFGEEKGSALVLVTVGMVVFMGIAAIVVDVGRLYLEKQRLANAIDAAALAASQELVDNPSNAENIALQYIEHNGFTSADVVVSVLPSGIDIKGTETRQTFFARVLGFEQATVGAEAKARIGSVGGLIGIIPFGLEEQELVFGQDYALKVGGGSGDHGWFGALALGGQGASNYEKIIKYGYEELIRVGDVLEVEPGNMSGPTRAGISYRVNACNHYPKCSAAHYEKDCPTLVYVPIVRQLETGDGRNESVEVRGFAAMILANTPGNGDDSEVYGSFVKIITPGELADNGADWGMKTIKLIE